MLCDFGLSSLHETTNAAGYCQCYTLRLESNPATPIGRVTDVPRYHHNFPLAIATEWVVLEFVSNAILEFPQLPGKQIPGSNMYGQQQYQSNPSGRYFLEEDWTQASPTANRVHWMWRNPESSSSHPRSAFPIHKPSWRLMHFLESELACTLQQAKYIIPQTIASRRNLQSVL